jgi:hypothetical protein
VLLLVVLLLLLLLLAWVFLGARASLCQVDTIGSKTKKVRTRLAVACSTLPERQRQLSNSGKPD